MNASKYCGSVQNSEFHGYASTNKQLDKAHGCGCGGRCIKGFTR